MTVYDVIFEELCSRVESGVLTLEDARVINDIAYERYNDVSNAASVDIGGQQRTIIFKDEYLQQRKALMPKVRKLAEAAVKNESAIIDTVYKSKDIQDFRLKNKDYIDHFEVGQDENKKMIITGFTHYNNMSFIIENGGHVRKDSVTNQ